MEIPEKISLFRAYVGNSSAENNLAGITDEVTLPEFEFMSEPLSLAGMAGEYDSPSVGQMKSAQIEIPFSNISEQALKLAADDSQPLILRGAQEVLDTATMKKRDVGRVITVMGMTKSINYGKLKKGGYGEPSIKKEIATYKDVVDGKVVTDINKIDPKCVINGVDLLKGITDLL